MLTLTDMYEKNAALEEEVERLSEENYFLLQRIDALENQVIQLAHSAPNFGYSAKLQDKE